MKQLASLTQLRRWRASKTLCLLEAFSKHCAISVVIFGFCLEPCFSFSLLLTTYYDSERTLHVTWTRSQFWQIFGATLGSFSRNASLGALRRVIKEEHRNRPKGDARKKPMLLPSKPCQPLFALHPQIAPKKPPEYDLRHILPKPEQYRLTETMSTPKEKRREWERDRERERNKEINRER